MGALATSLAAAFLLLAASPARAQDACADLHRKAAQLRNGADNCDSAVANGQMSSCQVHVPFALSSIPALAGQVPVGDSWLTSPASARVIASKLDAIRCVQSLQLSVDPPGPLQPGDTFTITAKVTMADGASPAGIKVSLTPENPELVAFNAADNGRTDTRIARKAAGPMAGGIGDIGSPITDQDGVARIPGMVTQIVVTPDELEEIKDAIQVALAGLRDLILSAGATEVILSIRKKEEKKPVWVVRGGVTTPDQLQNGVKEHAAVPGLIGFSVQSAPGKSIEELALAGRYPHNQISYTTVDQLLSAGVLRLVPSPGEGYHNTAVTPMPLSNEQAALISAVFKQMPNPAKR